MIGYGDMIVISVVIRGMRLLKWKPSSLSDKQFTQNGNIMFRLENWEMSGKFDPAFTAPEAQLYLITGEVYGHPDFMDGEPITTSSIEGAVGNIVTTHSGSEYELGQPDMTYVMWCEEAGCHIPTPDEPIKML